MMKHRLVYGATLAIAALAGLLYLPLVGAFAVFAILTVLLMKEFYGLFKIADPPFPIFDRIGIVCGLALLTAAFLDSIPPFSRRLDVLSLDSAERFVVFLSIAVVMVRQFPQKHNQQPLMTIAGTLFGIFYVAYLLTFLLRLGIEFDPNVRWNRPMGETGRFLLFYLLAVVKAGDSGALFVGCRWGRHKLFPRISPNKSWEGLVGGMAVGTVAGLLLFYLLGQPVTPVLREFGRLRWSVADALAMGLILTAAGAIGDLVESLIKRAVDVKDSGRVIPGLGGLLDVFDSVLYTAPILYFYTTARLLW
jgi:phosphatidate cytidylyltransferase